MTVRQNDIIEAINNRLGAAAKSVEAMKNDDVMVVVDRDRLVFVMATLKNDPDLGFTTLMNHLGVDYGDRFAVIYNLYSPALRRKATVKVFVPRDSPEAPSLEPLFRGINWFERETYDMLGINFTGHGNLKRLLLPEDWEGFPLRKDYVYPASYRGISTARADMLDEVNPAGEEHV